MTVGFGPTGKEVGLLNRRMSVNVSLGGSGSGSVSVSVSVSVV